MARTLGCAYPVLSIDCSDVLLTTSPPPQGERAFLSLHLVASAAGLRA